MAQKGAPLPRSHPHSSRSVTSRSTTESTSTAATPVAEGSTSLFGAPQHPAGGRPLLTGQRTTGGDSSSVADGPGSGSRPAAPSRRRTAAHVRVSGQRGHHRDQPDARRRRCRRTRAVHPVPGRRSVEGPGVMAAPPRSPTPGPVHHARQAPALLHREPQPDHHRRGTARPPRRAADTVARRPLPRPVARHTRPHPRQRSPITPSGTAELTPPSPPA